MKEQRFAWQAQRNAILGLTGFLLSLLGAVNFSAAQKTPDVSASLDQVIQEARKEGDLNVTWGPSTLGGIEALNIFAGMIKKKYGVDTKIRLTPGPSMSQMGARILQERQAGRNASSDLFVGFDVHMPRLNKADFFLPVEWKSLFPEMGAWAIEINGRIVRVYDGVMGFVYNTKLVKPNEVPKRFEDIFKPQWQKKIAGIPSATGLNLWSYLVGEQRGDPTVKKFAEEYVKGLIRTTEYERIVSGEFPLMVFGGSLSQAEELQQAGAPIDYTAVLDAPWLSTVYVGIP